MTRRKLLDFTAIWAVDFEFVARAGECPSPHTMVARELKTGRTLRFTGNELRSLRVPPFDTGPDSVYVAYYASAEMGCHLALGWPMPVNVLDLFTEFKNMTNGLPTPSGAGLLGALTYFGLAALAATEKEEMRELAMRGEPYTAAEQQALLEYCETDVDALERLLPKMEGHLDLERALLRGRYMKAAAHIEHVGVPVDVSTLAAIKVNWLGIQDRLIARIDADFGIYEGRTFKSARFAEWLQREDLPWPRLESGALDLSDDAFRHMSRVHAGIATLRELRHALSEMRLNDLAVGLDGRNRCLLSAFRAKTGRNQPSNSKFIFGPAVWLRALIMPSPGMGLAYIDWEQQEFGIAAALSGDEAMKAAYRSGDPYLEFAKQAGAAPPDATKKTHEAVRNQYKECALGVQYGMGEVSLAQRLGKPVAYARELLHLHQTTYPQYWKWSEAAASYAMLHGVLWTVFGWEVHVGAGVNPRSLGNFPMQANGAEMLRLACCLATERGIRICAPVHDAILIEAPLADLDDAARATQAAMVEASSMVLGGFELRTEVQIVRYPDRFMDEKRGRAMWEIVMALIAQM